MRVSPAAALLLPALAAAESQIPFSAQLSSLWDSITPYLYGHASPYDTTFASSHTPTRSITNLTAQNWLSEFSTQPSEPWLVLVTGGNVTCGAPAQNASCAGVDSAWDVASLSARTDPRAPNLGHVDCEDNRLLCATWGASPASVWWVQPEVRVSKSADTQAARVTAREAEIEGAVPLDSIPDEVSREIWVVGLNKTTVTAGDITALYKKGEWKTRGEKLGHEEILSRHPFNGQLARWGLNVPVGYVYFVLGMFPSWTTIMMLSFTARMFLNRQKAPKETPAQRAERERKGKYQENGKVRGAAPGDGTNMGRL